MRKGIALALLVIMIVVSRGNSMPVPSLAVAQDDELTCVEQVRLIQSSDQSDIVERYRPLRVVDAHSHDAAFGPSAIDNWDEFGVDQTALFGAISEPRARFTDQMAFAIFRMDSTRVYPYFAGVSIYEDNGLDMLREDLEAGFFGIGEIVGASTQSPTTRDLEWKAEHPNDGHFPELYRLSAEYGLPVMLHIDPPFGYPIMKLEEALDENPDTIIVFAHANAYNPPENIEPLLRNHPNLYFDFFVGFTAKNPGSQNTLADFVPLVEAYADRIFVSTDSGFDIGYDNAVIAIYELFDLLTPETVCKVSHENIDAIMAAQPPTATQLARLAELAPEMNTTGLNKMDVHTLIFELEMQDGSSAG